MSTLDHSTMCKERHDAEHKHAVWLEDIGRWRAEQALTHLEEQTLTQHDDTWERVERNATQTLDGHPHFHGRTNTIRIEHHHDTVILTGRLPSFYLKQLLQEALRQVDGVDRIDNRVDVISCDGLSGIPNQ